MNFDWTPIKSPKQLRSAFLVKRTAADNAVSVSYKRPVSFTEQTLNGDQVNFFSKPHKITTPPQPRKFVPLEKKMSFNTTQLKQNLPLIDNPKEIPKTYKKK